MQIKITCKVDTLVPITSLQGLQGVLKTISAEAKAKLKESIIRYGFSAPVFVWKDAGKDYVLDGHQRLTALNELLAEGHTIEGVPVIYIDAPDEPTAKSMLLTYASQYGKIDPAGLAQYLTDAEIAPDLSIAQAVVDLPDYLELSPVELDAPDEELPAHKEPTSGHVVITYGTDKERRAVLALLGITVKSNNVTYSVKDIKGGRYDAKNS